MIKFSKRITFEEFAGNLADVFRRVVENGETIVIEKERGHFVALNPVPPDEVEDKSAEDWAAFRAAAGSWDDVDTDAWLDKVREGRRLSRPPVDL